jgi:hypothetical protein
LIRILKKRGKMETTGKYTAPKASGIPVYCSHTKIEEIKETKPNPNTQQKKQITILSRIIKDQEWRNPTVVSRPVNP